MNIEDFKEIFTKAAKCFGICGGALAILFVFGSFFVPQNAAESVSEAETTSYTPVDEKPLESENSGYSVYSSETSQDETDPEDTPAVRYTISDEERRAIERIVASEGGYCEYEFQALVAECILNGCEADDMRPLELFDRGDFWLTHNVEPTEVTKQAVSDVFDKGIMPTAEKIRYYYNPSYCQSEVHEKMRYVFTHTGCRFFTDW